MAKEDFDALKAKNLRCHSIGEPYLHAEIRNIGRRLKCDYCGRKAKAIKLEEMPARIEKAFETHYVLTPRTVRIPGNGRCCRRESPNRRQAQPYPNVSSCGCKKPVPDAFPASLFLLIGSTVPRHIVHFHCTLAPT